MRQVGGGVTKLANSVEKKLCLDLGSDKNSVVINHELIDLGSSTVSI